MFKSFILRLALILSTTAAICLALMVATLAIQMQHDAMVFCATLLAILVVWVVVNLIVVRKTDPELTVEVAWVVLPSGAVLSIFLSLLLAMLLSDMIPGEEGNQHWIIPLAGIGVAIYLGIRCLDIKWLRGEQEILAIEERDR
jgi:amino acid transporter